MTDESIASFFSQPLGIVFLAAVVAAITSVATVKIMVAHGLITAAPSPADDRAPYDPAVVAAIAAAIAATSGAARIVHIAAVHEHQRMIIATIVAAIAALFSNARIVQIGIVPSSTARKTQFGVPPTAS